MLTVQQLELIRTYLQSTGVRDCDFDDISIDEVKEEGKIVVTLSGKEYSLKLKDLENFLLNTAIDFKENLENTRFVSDVSFNRESGVVTITTNAVI